MGLGLNCSQRRGTYQMKKFFFVLFLLSCFGCTSYQITSKPEGAAIRYRNSRRTYPTFLPNRTPHKVRKGIEWPYWYNNVAVEWPDGTFSDWRHLDRDQHFEKDKAQKSHELVDGFHSDSRHLAGSNLPEEELIPVQCKSGAPYLSISKIDNVKPPWQWSNKYLIPPGQHTITVAIDNRHGRVVEFTALKDREYEIVAYSGAVGAKGWRDLTAGLDPRLWAVAIKDSESKEIVSDMDQPTDRTSSKRTPMSAEDARVKMLIEDWMVTDDFTNSLFCGKFNPPRSGKKYFVVKGKIHTKGDMKIRRLIVAEKRFKKPETYTHVLDDQGNKTKLSYWESKGGLTWIGGDVTSCFIFRDGAPFSLVFEIPSDAKIQELVLYYSYEKGVILTAYITEKLTFSFQ